MPVVVGLLMILLESVKIDCFYWEQLTCLSCLLFLNWRVKDYYCFTLYLAFLATSENLSHAYPPRQVAPIILYINRHVYAEWAWNDVKGILRIVGPRCAAAAATYTLKYSTIISRIQRYACASIVVVSAGSIFNMHRNEKFLERQ